MVRIIIFQLELCPEAFGVIANGAVLHAFRRAQCGTPYVGEIATVHEKRGPGDDSLKGKFCKDPVNDLQLIYLK